MNTVQWIQRIALVILAVFVLAPRVVAQDETDADTIWVDGDKTLVIIGDDGRRIIVRSADGDGPRVFFDSDDHAAPHVFDFEPGRFRFRNFAPRMMEFQGDLLDDDDVTVLSDYLGNLDGVWAGRLGDDFRVELGESMKERSEVMRMEQESRRLAQRARQAEGEERARLEAELTTQLNALFDRKQALQEERIERLRDELDEMLGKHNERSQHRDEIIERRLRQLLGKEDKYDW